MALDPWSKQRAAVPFRNASLFHLSVSPENCHVVVMLPTSLAGAKSVEDIPVDVEYTSQSSSDRTPAEFTSYIIDWVQFSVLFPSGVMNPWTFV